MALKRPPSTPARLIDDRTVLSQYGRLSPNRPAFRSGPRPHESYQSLSAGRRTVEEMAVLVASRPAEDCDRVRYTTAAKLRAAGFVVTSWATVRNPDHVAVSLRDMSVPWDDGAEKAFESCFEEEGSGCT